MRAVQRWTPATVPVAPSGGTAVITGANTGLGRQTARVLAGRGLTVVLACRDGARAAAAVDSIVAETGGRVSAVELDLADLTSVRRAADQLRRTHRRLDLLINNAGVMAPPAGRTADGFEHQLGVNHLGHFALTGLLLEPLRVAPAARVVTVSSLAHWTGRLDPTRLSDQPGRWAGYARSKLANLLFTAGLAERLAGTPVRALAAHPGLSATELERNLPAPLRLVFRLSTLQDATLGALPVLRAALDPTAGNGDYYGPDGWLQWRGFPRLVSRSGRAADAALATRLWTRSEELTGVSYGP